MYAYNNSLCIKRQVTRIN